jgi:undecaprenyl pyrophosphate phosphatase UppP
MIFDADAHEVMLWEHAPTTVVVALFFIREWLFLIRNIRRTWYIVSKLIFFMLCSNIITTVMFIIVRIYKIEIPLRFGFGITTVLLLSLIWCRRPLRVLTTSRALVLGITQGIAWMPGVSRFAAVFVASRWMGISNRRAWRITWMLEWPMAFGVSALSLAQWQRVTRSAR